MDYHKDIEKKSDDVNFWTRRSIHIFIRICIRCIVPLVEWIRQIQLVTSMWKLKYLHIYLSFTRTLSRSSLFIFLSILEHSLCNYNQQIKKNPFDIEAFMHCIWKLTGNSKGYYSKPIDVPSPTWWFSHNLSHRFSCYRTSLWVMKVSLPSLVL